MCVSSTNLVVVRGFVREYISVNVFSYVHFSASTRVEEYKFVVKFYPNNTKVTITLIQWNYELDVTECSLYIEYITRLT